MSTSCSLCGKQFSRTNNLKRHVKSQHRNAVSLVYLRGPDMNPAKTIAQNSNPKLKRADCGAFQLLHPFTALVAGMTGSGKTVWVQKLLEHANEMISPPPQRIIWCYSQWQPAYEQMQHSVSGIEFVKGIPADLEEDWYLNEGISNLIVVDDQMAEASSDKRVLNLFTKGSHHRNLSVIFLLQNLFHQGKINRTISLNSHYLVLFKNPRDKLQIMTLAKQMYPGGTESFMKKYEEAVSRPYGYLLVDLKPNTPERCRLRTNVLPNDLAPQRPKGMAGAEAIEEFLRRESISQPPEIKEMSRLDKDMDQILARSDLPADVKAQMYAQKLQRYLNFQRHFRSPPSFHNEGGPLIQPQNLPQEQLSPVLTQPPSHPDVTTPVAKQWWQTIATPIKQTVQIPTSAEPTPTPSPGLGDSPFPTPPLSTKRRIQPSRKKKKPQWIPYIKSGPIGRGSNPHKLRTGKMKAKLQPVLKMPEKWTRYIDI